MHTSMFYYDRRGLFDNSIGTTFLQYNYNAQYTAVSVTISLIYECSWVTNDKRKRWLISVIYAVAAMAQLYYAKVCI